MNVVQRIAKNVFFISTSQLFIKGINFIFIIFLARLIGVQDFGKYSFVTALFGMLSLLANFGLDTLLIRNIARNKTLPSVYLSNSFLIKFIISLLILVIFFILFGFTNIITDYIKRYCFIISCFILIFNCATQTIWSFADAYEQMHYRSLLSAFYNFAKTLIGLVLVFRGYGLIILFLGLLFAEILSFIVTILVVNKALKLPKWEIDFNVILNLIRDSWPFALLGFLGLIYFRIDIIILSWLKGDEVVGWYNAAYGLLIGLIFLPDSLVTALFPVMSRYYKNSEQALKLTYQKSIKYLFILGLPIATGVIILANKIILFLYGQAYVMAVPALQILGWAILLIFINAPLGRLLFSIDKQKDVLALSLITVSANIILNLLMIPKLSYIGSGIATFLSEVLSSLIFFSFLTKFSFKFSLIQLVLKPLVACLLMIIFLCVFKQINLFLLIFLAGCIYTMVLFITKTFDQDDEYLLKRIFQKVK